MLAMAATLGKSKSVPPDISSILHRACYNCHSNETHWPWYSNLPVIGKEIHEDVDRGRAMLNFSEWRGDNPGLLPAACNDVKRGTMPKRSYTWLHPEARLTPQEKQRFCAWANQQ